MRFTRALSTVLMASWLTAGAAAAATPIASAESNLAGVTIDLMALERKGNILTVKFAVRNGGSESATIQIALTGDRVTTYLVDEENGTKYFALTDKEKNVLASEHEYTGSSFGISDDIKAGETKRYWAKFPAPPPEVKTITVMFTQAEPLEDLAITDK